ncbi:hypothetical protein BT96DRAFT_615321 [Gymnopus androsaceus JB14]|uniref:Uncharacterized protein n=1 Tax=Gymnopus androsaceus JB14 TaxID=1447944 RepID=A0A6A4HX68_9AGAR|nr:hypothetical protein BT96DRAFT_615321 [Gymnopus androsaceus JB14]
MHCPRFVVFFLNSGDLCEASGHTFEVALAFKGDLGRFFYFLGRCDITFFPPTSATILYCRDDAIYAFYSF